ncbi:MAG TPA: hypothetical protein VGM51_13475 [Armatimonadota bacterium]|jgi:hypothetical protein
MAQQIITWLVVGAAAFLVLRHLWREVEGFIHPDRAGQCPGCGMCDAAEDARKSGRRPLEPKITPLVRLNPKWKPKQGDFPRDDRPD